MPFQHQIEGRVVHIEWHGVVSKRDLQEVGRLMPRVAAEVGFAPDVLHTFGAMQGYSFQPIAVYMLSLLRKRAEIPAGVRSATIATTPEQRKIARLFQSLNRSPNLEMRVFGDEQSARAWLART